MTNIKPLGRNILVKPIEEKESTTSGIVLPDSEKENTTGRAGCSSRVE